MASPMVFEVIVPKKNASDNSVVIVDCRFNNGSPVQSGDCVSICETSKTTLEVTAEKSGYIFYLYKPNESVAVGEPLAIITESPSFSLEAYKAQVRAKSEKDGRAARDREINNSQVKIALENGGLPHFSDRAISLIIKSGLKHESFVGQEFITESDVFASLRDISAGRSLNEETNKETTALSTDIVIFGGGGHAKMCIDMLQVMGLYRIVGIVASDLPINSSVLGIRVIGREMDLPKIFASGVRNAVLAIGAAENHCIRETLFNKLKLIGFSVPNLIHPTAAVERSVVMGEGNQVMANATIGSCVRLGHNCIINSGAIVSHDSHLEDNVHISPGAALAGLVSVGANSLIGMNATVFMKVNIGQGVTVFNGKSILKNIDSGSIVQ